MDNTTSNSHSCPSDPCKWNSVMWMERTSTKLREKKTEEMKLEKPLSDVIQDYRLRRKWSTTM